MVARLLPPIGKQKRTLPVIHAEERRTPNNKKKIDWKSTIDRPVGSRADAIGKHGMLRDGRSGCSTSLKSG